MGRVKRQKRHCQEIAQRKKDYVSPDKSDNSSNSSDEEDEVSVVDNEIEHNSDQLFLVLMKNSETLKSSKRPLVNLGNSRTTKFRKNKKALENREKNGQTLYNLWDINNNNNNNDNFASFINQIDNKLKVDNQLTPGHKMRLKAIQYYFQLLDKGRAKLEASQIIAELLNRGIWFA